MDSVIDMSVARALVSDAVLWPRVKAFLWDFAPQIHASWMADLDDVARFMSSPRAKRYVLDKLGIAPVFHTFPKDDWSRIALLDGETLLSMAKWLGAIACADALRSITKGAEVRALKAGLTGVYPDIFAFMAYFRGLSLRKKHEDALNADAVLSVGVEILFSCLHGLDDALVKRVALKLPKSLFDACNCGKKSDDEIKCLKKLLKIKFPEAYKLCC